MKTPQIQFIQVTHAYERSGQPPILALDHVNLEVFDREILCIVGPSGCGKTTAINLAAGYLHPRSGEILVRDQRVCGPIRRCGIVFQGDATFPWMSVGNNVAYGLMIRGVPTAKRQKRTLELLDKVGLKHSVNQWPRELSGGMKKRVELARMLATDPDVLLLDEPFASLDPLTKEEIHGIFLDLWYDLRGAVIVVTHDVEEAVFLGGRVAVMSHRPGRVTSTLPVPFSYPRDPAIKLSSQFVEIRAAILSKLREPDGEIRP